MLFRSKRRERARESERARQKEREREGGEIGSVRSRWNVPYRNMENKQQDREIQKRRDRER